MDSQNTNYINPIVKLLGKTDKKIKIKFLFSFEENQDMIDRQEKIDNELDTNRKVWLEIKKFI